MKTILRTLIVIAAIWAVLAPAMYVVLFEAFADWSAIFDFLIVFSCGVLFLAAFKNISLGIWLAAFAVVAVFGVSGFSYHFQDSGQSGPLPFEWLNSYFVQALPLLLIALLARFFEPNKEAVSGRGGRIAPATPPTPPGMRLRTGRFQSDSLGD